MVIAHLPVAAGAPFLLKTVIWSAGATLRRFTRALSHERISLCARRKNPLDGTIEGVAQRCQTNSSGHPFSVSGAAFLLDENCVWPHSPAGVQASHVLWRPASPASRTDPSGTPILADGKMATPVPRDSCALFCYAAILAKIRVPVANRVRGAVFRGRDRLARKTL